MSRKYKYWDCNKMYFMNFATVNWIDVFKRNEYKDEIIKAGNLASIKKGLRYMPGVSCQLIYTCNKQPR